MLGRPFSTRYPFTMEIILETQRSNFSKSHGVVSGGWKSEESEQVLLVDTDHTETTVDSALIF